MKAIAFLGVMLASLATLTPVRADAGTDKPVRVYILSGQSNMVGIGQVSGGSSRWGKEMIDPVLSVYPGPYDAKADYDAMTATQTLKLESFGGVSPTPYPGGGTQVVRGFVQMGSDGVYEFNPGHGGSVHNIMAVDGKEVHRQEPGQKAVKTPVALKAGQKVPFKIVYLTESANGLGWTTRVDTPGTLTTLVKQQGKHPQLLGKDGDWAVRDDVWYKGVVTATANKWLSVGCGASPGQIGPELGFGWVVGDAHDAPVLILKASQGNRSLGWDFLPPGSERFEQDGKVYAGYKDPQPEWAKGTEPAPGAWYAGKQYDDCFQATHAVLKDFDQNFPQWKGRGYEIAGFGWWQGHKDSGSAVHRQRYEQNLVHLINTLRAEFKAPNAPFVVATVGFHGQKMPEVFVPIFDAQMAVDGDTGKHPAFKGNVKSVDTRGFWREADVSPKQQDFHYNQNGETYYLVGEAMGKAMLELEKAR